MTDLLNVLKDNDQTCALIYRQKQGFSQITWSVPTPSWLPRCPVCNPRLEALFLDQTAVSRKRPTSRYLVPKLGIISSTPYTPHIRFVRKPSVLRKLINRCPPSDNVMWPSKGRAALLNKETMSCTRGIIDDLMTSRPHLETSKDHHRTSTCLTINVRQRNRDCFMHTKKKYRRLILTPSAQITCPCLCRLRQTEAKIHSSILMDQTIDHSKRWYNNRNKTSSTNMSQPKQEVPETNAFEKPRPYISLSCTPFFRLSNQKKEANELDIDDLEKLAQGHKSPQESVSEYRYGGYKPVTIGEELGNRYKVIRKLGYGHFSTVWLCQDTTEEHRSNYVAVKVVKSANIYAAVASDEIQLLQSVLQRDRTHEGAKKIIQMLDYFKEQSINGLHYCLTFELMGPSLLHLLMESDYKGIQLPGVKNIIRQVLQGLEYLHEICKIIHTDLKPENILIKIKESYIPELIATMNRYEELGVMLPKSYVSAECWRRYDYIGKEESEENAAGGDDLDSVRRTNSYPKENVGPQFPHHDDIIHLKKPMWISPNIEVKIADLGNACWEDRHFSANIQTKQYRALEVLLRAGYSFPADIWSVGCLAFELATGEYLFNPKDRDYCNSTQDHILLIFELLGGIPNYIAQRGTHSHKYFDNAGNLKIIDSSKLRIWNTEAVLVEKYHWKRVDAIPFANMLQQMVEPDPELRITASIALQSEWLNDISS